MGQGMTKTLWGSDPDQPDPVSGLSKRDISNIRRSWAPIWANATHVGQDLLKRMCNDNSTKALYKMFRQMDEEALKKSDQFKAYVIGFMSNLNMLVTHIHEPGVVISLMHTLGGLHTKDRTPTKYFEIMEAELLDFLKEDCKLDYTTVDSWKRFTAFLHQYSVKHG